MSRRLSTVASAVSLLLFVATLVLWVRSYHAGDCWRVRRHRTYECNSFRGLVTLSVETRFSRTTYRLPPHVEQTILPVARTWRAEHHRISALLVAQVLDKDTRQFRVVRNQQFPGLISPDLRVVWEIGFITSYVRFPQWCMAALFLVLPTAWAAMMCRRRIRIAAGRCTFCGYDLRASPDRCPGCGVPVLKKAGSAT